MAEQEDPLLLSYCEESGTYIDEATGEEKSTHHNVLQNPHKWMANNRQNTIELIARDSAKFQSFVQQKLEKYKSMSSA